MNKLKSSILSSILYQAGALSVETVPLKPPLSSCLLEYSSIRAYFFFQVFYTLLLSIKALKTPRK